MKQKLTWIIPCLLGICILMLSAEIYFKNDPAPNPSAPDHEDDVSADDLCPYAIQYGGVTYYYDSRDEYCVPEGQLQIYQVLGTIQTSVPGNQMPAQDFETNISGQVGLTLYRVDRAVLLLNDAEHGAWYYVPELVQYNGAYYWGAKTVVLSQEELPAGCSLIGTIQSTVPSSACPMQDMESNRYGDQGRNLYRVNDQILLMRVAKDREGPSLYTCFYLYE